MEDIKLHISNPEIQKFLLQHSEAQNKSVNALVEEIIELFYHSRHEDNIIPHKLLFKLIRQSEQDYREGKVTKHSEFVEKTKKW